MTSNAAETAKQMMQERRGHCGQAVLTSVSEQASSKEVDYDTLMKISAAFGGGIARMGNVCGALTGALMALGLKYGGQDSSKVDRIAKLFLDEFKALHESIICRELIDHDLITDEDVEKAFKTGAFDNCPKFVEDAVVLLEKLL
jgi:C_GCAxxG_C_C family probable redox protein